MKKEKSKEIIQKEIRDFIKLTEDEKNEILGFESDADRYDILNMINGITLNKRNKSIEIYSKYKTVQYQQYKKYNKLIDNRMKRFNKEISDFVKNNYSNKKAIDKIVQHLKPREPRENPLMKK